MLRVAEVRLHNYQIKWLYLLIKRKDNIRDSVSGTEYFHADYAFIATWGNVTFLGINNRNLETRPVLNFKLLSL
jgi:hypothetical protein